MATKVKSFLNRAGEYFRKANKKKLILICIAAVIVISAGIIGAVLLNRVNYTVLYSELSAEEAGTIKSLLDEMGVDSKAKGTDTILVPADQADDIRIKLAADGYPSTGLNYNIFSNSSALGSTDLERQTYLQYQLQENMRATICKMDKVEDCIVIVNLSNSSSFVLSSNTTEASVAVMLELEPGETLTDSEAKSIGEFVAKCVPNLKYENISIVDSNMHYYDITSDSNSNSNSNSDNGYSTTQQELTERMKAILNEQVISVLEPAVGTSNLAVTVNLDLNFDKQTTSQVEFSTPVKDASNGLVRSSEVSRDLNTDGSTSGASGEAGTDSNGVSASEYVSNANTAGVTGASATDTYNYELNQVQTDIEKAQGTIQNLSVSVLINSNVAGISDYVDGVKSLVANAIGVDPQYITVELMPFVQGSGDLSFDDYLSLSDQNLQKYNISRLIKVGIIVGAVLIAALVALLVMRRKKKKKAAALEQKASGETKKAPAAKVKSETPAVNTDVDDMLAKLVMKKSDESEVVEELMDKYPETVVQILRTWLTED